jgi:hypothetical protein
MEKNMLPKFKALISILGIIALVLTTFCAISFADRGEREYRSSRSSDSERSSRYHRSDRYDRYDRYDRDDDDDDDDDAVTNPNPNPGPSQDPLCSTCHPYPGTNTLPSGHRSIGGISTPDPTPTPTPAPTPTPNPGPSPNPGPTPDPLCSSCHQYPGTNTLPSGHRSIGGTSTPTPTPAPPVVDTTPSVDGSAAYNTYCSGCHGQANKGKNIPSSHLGDSRASGIPQDVKDAINAL